MTNINMNHNKKTSLATLVTGAFVVIVVLSLISTALSYNRLINFNTILANITGNSLPDATRANQINNILKEVLYLTERLTNANNHAARRIAGSKLLEQDIRLSLLIETFGASIHINNQIKTARNEINDLNTLIINRIENQELIDAQLDQAYKLQDAIIAELSASAAQNNFFEQGSIPVIQSIALTSKAISLDRLQPVRQIAKAIDKNLVQVKRLAMQQSNLNKKSLVSKVDTLQTVLVGDSGLINLRIQQLQINGRARGRGNFLHNLIVDISRLADSNSYKINESIVIEAQETATKISTQVKWSVSLAVFVVLLLIAIIYVINERIVARLVSLNDKVVKRIKSPNTPIKAEGNDEISELAQSFIYFAEKVEQQKEQLQKLSLTDSLTALPNRRAMDERLTHDVHTAKRGHWPLSIILLDIDYFKPYNDHYGHVAGDECLKKVALALNNIQQRDSDFMARYGGEEFAMLMPSPDEEGAIKIANRIKSAIEQYKLPHEESEISNTIS